MKIEKISFCIPTYKRMAFLEETIESIFSQKSNWSIEVVVSDNDSNDGTYELIQRLSEKYGKERLIYFLWDSNVGADKNYLKTVELATGDYCWLFGSDDVLRENALKDFEEVYQSNPNHGVYLSNRLECDLNMEIQSKRNWTNLKATTNTFNFRESDEIMEYLISSLSLGALFSFISSVVVRRNSWIQQVVDEEYIGSLYSHVFMIFGILRDSSFCFINEYYVKCRTNNDSFFDSKNVAKRINIDIQGYLSLAQRYFSEDHDALNEIKRIISDEIFETHTRLTLKELLLIKINSDPKEFSLLIGNFKKINLYNCACFFAALSPLWSLNLMRRLYKLIRRNS